MKRNHTIMQDAALRPFEKEGHVEIFDIETSEILKPQSIKNSPLWKADTDFENDMYGDVALESLFQPIEKHSGLIQKVVNKGNKWKNILLTKKCEMFDYLYLAYSRRMGIKILQKCQTIMAQNTFQYIRNTGQGFKINENFIEINRLAQGIFDQELNIQVSTETLKHRLQNRNKLKSLFVYGWWQIFYAPSDKEFIMADGIMTVDQLSGRCWLPVSPTKGIMIYSPNSKFDHPKDTIVEVEISDPETELLNKCTALSALNFVVARDSKYLDSVDQWREESNDRTEIKKITSDFIYNMDEPGVLILTNKNHLK